MLQLVAHQTLHRSAKVAPGEKILIVGASGGVGTALLPLAELAGARVYTIASKTKLGVLLDYDGTSSHFLFSKRPYEENWATLCSSAATLSATSCSFQMTSGLGLATSARVENGGLG